MSLSSDDDARSNSSIASSSLDLTPEVLAQKLARLNELETCFNQAVEAAKLAALKEFAYGAGHEINNPLANISARAQTLLKDERDPERRRKMAAINAQAFRAHEMIADLMLFARPPQLKMQQIDLPSLIDKLIAQLTELAQVHRTTIVRQGAPAFQPILADETQLSVALRALCMNALEAVGLDGRIEIELRQSDAATEIFVRDNGPGIPAEIRSRIFDPFFSGREAGRGLGFGLPKAWRIISEHGGTIEVIPKEPRGTVTRIRLSR